MGYWSFLKKEIKVDSNFGDFELENNDLKTTRNPTEVLVDTVIERYKTNYKDFILNPNYGANLQQYLGKGVNHALADSIVTSFKYILTYDNFLSLTEVRITPIILGNSIKLFTYISVANGELELVVTLEEGELTVDK